MIYHKKRRRKYPDGNARQVSEFDTGTCLVFSLFSLLARRPRALSRRPTFGAYESFPDVFTRRGRRKDVASTSRPNQT